MIICFHEGYGKHTGHLNLGNGVSVILNNDFIGSGLPRCCQRCMSILDLIDTS